MQANYTSFVMSGMEWMVQGQPDLILPKILAGCAQLNVGKTIIPYAGGKVTTVNANEFKNDTVLWQ